MNFLAPPVSGDLVGREAMHGARGVFLNTALDVDSAPHLPITALVWNIRYEFFAIDFPVLSVWIEITLRN